MCTTERKKSFYSFVFTSLSCYLTELMQQPFLVLLLKCETEPVGDWTLTCYFWSGLNRQCSRIKPDAAVTWCKEKKWKLKGWTWSGGAFLKSKIIVFYLKKKENMSDVRAVNNIRKKWQTDWLIRRACRNHCPAARQWPRDSYRTNEPTQIILPLPH